MFLKSLCNVFSFFSPFTINIGVIFVVIRGPFQLLTDHSLSQPTHTDILHFNFLRKCFRALSTFLVLWFSSHLMIVGMLLQIPKTSSSQSSPDAAPQMLTMMCPAFVPGMVPLQSTENNDHGPGIYAVPVRPFMGSMVGFPPNTLIPLKYNIPT